MSQPTSAYLAAPASPLLADLTPGTPPTTPRRFTGIAYAGGPVQPYAVATPFIIDLASLRLPARCPVLDGHDRDARLGVCDLRVADGALTCDGHLLPNEDATQLAADADAGFPFQMSVHAEAGAVEQLAAGASATVNGRALSGPLQIWRQTRIREVSFTPTGVDPATTAQLLSLPPLISTHEALMSQPTPAADPAANAPTAETVATLSARVQALEAERDTLQARLAAAPGPDLLAQLQAQIATLTAAEQTRTREAALAAAVADGRLVVGTPLYAHAAQLAAEPLTALLASLTPLQALTGQQTGGQPPAGAAPFSAALAAEFGDQATYDAFIRAETAGRIRINPRGED